MNEPLRIFIGWDSKEPLAYAVLSHSILARASVPVSITPLTRKSVAQWYTRPTGQTEATEFSMTRFLVPFLSGYRGWSVFMDCDMLCRIDVADLWKPIASNPGLAVYCCQHDYTPKRTEKFEGHTQTRYPRKNWSSFMVFDTVQCQALTPDYVNTATGLDLHRLHWMADDRIGALPLDFNWLVGEYPTNDAAKIWHFTNGTPCFQDYASCDHSVEWWQEYRSMERPRIATSPMVGA